MTFPQRKYRLLVVFLSILIFASLTFERSNSQTKRQSKSKSQPTDREKMIAARFAPIFYQALAENRRADYITNFDFDGDWRGDNNWSHTNDKDYPLKAYVYYSMVETRSHYFLHYAVFHTRDYKGGERKGAIISELIREGAKRAGKYDPTGIAEESALAHENDMEGCLLAVEKSETDAGGGKVVFLETLRHNTISKYRVESSEKESEALRLQDGRPLLYIEPKGHGILALTNDKQTAGKDVLVYEYQGRADDPEKIEGRSIGFELLPLKTTLWSRARAGASITFAQTQDFGDVTIKLRTGDRESELKTQLGKIGVAFAGKVGGINMARPPWGWFDRSRREETLGVWFFDPATTIKRDFKLDESFSTAYLQKPFWAEGNVARASRP